MENIFGLDSQIVQQALINGILIDNNGDFVQQIGPLSLVYHPQLKRFVFVFGTTAENASFVLLEDINKTWKMK